MGIHAALRVRPVWWFVALVVHIGLLGLASPDVRADVVPPPKPSEPRTVKDGTFALTFQGQPPVCFATPAQWRDSVACEGVDPKELDPANLPIRPEGTLLARAVLRNHGGDLQVLLLKGPPQSKGFDQEDRSQYVREVIQSVLSAPLVKTGNGARKCTDATALVNTSSFHLVEVVTTRVRPTFSQEGASELKLEIEHHEIRAKDATYLLIVWYPLAVQERGHWESQFLLGNFIATRKELPGEALGYYTGLVALPGSLVAALLWIFLHQRRLNAQRRRMMSAAAGTSPDSRSR